LKIVGILFALVLTVALVMPAAAFAEDAYAGLANCAWDKVKWEDNANSWHLYLQHWGRTPIQAMTRLRGLCSPDVLCAQLGTNCPGAQPIYGDPNSCWSCGCPSCRDTEQGCLACCDDLAECKPTLCEGACPATACEAGECVGCNKELVWKNDLPHCAGCWGVSLAFASKSWASATIGTHPRINDNHLNHKGVSECYGGNKGGDWGLSGCPHTECCSLTWCLQDNCFASQNCAPK